jgi:hypothetical protein
MSLPIRDKSGSKAAYQPRNKVQAKAKGLVGAGFTRCINCAVQVADLKGGAHLLERYRRIEESAAMS